MKEKLKMIVCLAMLLAACAVPQTSFAAKYDTITTGTQNAQDFDLQHPSSAWKLTCAEYQEYSIQKPIDYELRLEELYTEDTANEFARSEFELNAVPDHTQNWFVMKFFLRNTGGKELNPSDIINYNFSHPHFYLPSGDVMTVHDTCIFTSSRRGIYDIQLAEGEYGYFWVGILVNKTDGYPIIKISTGYEHQEAQYGYLSTDPSACCHIWDTGKITQTPTCFGDGTRTLTCINCSVKNPIRIPLTQHNIKIQAATAPTCTKAGNTEGKYCSMCHAVFKKATSIPATGHSWSTWKTTTKATVFSEGKKTRQCFTCKKKATKVIAQVVPTIRLSHSSISLKTKKQFDLKISGLAAGDSVKAVKSSNSNLVTVSRKTDQIYTVKAKKAGTAKITVTLKSGKKAVCIVTAR